MSEAGAQWGEPTPIERVDGHLRLEDIGLLGDGDTACLIGRDGSVQFLCAPLFDDPPLFCPLLDPHRGGCFRLGPARIVAARHRYERDLPVLVTELTGPGGTMRITDLMTLRSGADLAEDTTAARGELLRRVEIIHGHVDLRIEIEAFGGSDATRAAKGFTLRPHRRRDLLVHLEADRPLPGPRCDLPLRDGDRIDLLLRWGRPAPHGDHPGAERLADQTRDAWRRWMKGISFDGPRPGDVRRSALVLKMLDRFATGGLVAAPTTSLPEEVGGARNWDYRFTWVRDAAFSVHAFRRIGLAHEARAFLGWVLDLGDHHDDVRIMHTTDGGPVPDERVEERLSGYRGSRPVRFGNGATGQTQHDVYGEFIDCAWQWAQQGGAIEDHLWERLRAHAERAAEVWRSPDAGIWEVRCAPRRFTYSAALCNVALDRAARLADERGAGDDARRWRREADVIRDAILDRAWNDARGALVDRLDGGRDGALDASLLALPLRGVVAADHPRMAATINAVAEGLGGGGGLIHRYLPSEYDDGVEGDEGAFLLCSFWLVDCLAAQGRVDEAGELFESLCGRASPLGLLPEQIDSSTGGFTGNFPQAFSHVGLISSAVMLGRGDWSPDREPI